MNHVSPTPIRLRILKVSTPAALSIPLLSFTHSDPFEDTERYGPLKYNDPPGRFTHSDPFEDTERLHDTTR